MDLLQKIKLAWIQHREFRAVLAELQSSTDRQLHEIGIARGDIGRIAYEEAERRVEELDRNRPDRTALQAAEA